MNAIATASRATVLLFTAVAGSVDAITYLTAHVFTANMTGNAVLLGIAAGQGKGAAAASSLIALLAFVSGVLLGALVVGEGDAASAAADVRRAVWIETLILAFFALACLAPRDREILVLRHLEQLSTREMAAVLGISEGAVKTRHLRALQRFRNLLNPENGSDLS